MPEGQLHVIALISGGKDSFYSLLHCLRNGHRVAALANLYPPHVVSGGERAVEGAALEGPKEEREASAAATKVDMIEPHAALGGGKAPRRKRQRASLYRRAITGGAAQSVRDYDGLGADGDRREETESMTELLRAVMKRHPEANAVCAGAILSTYQRTRVESVAVRLGLLLSDMADAGLDARIIKVASAGLDEEFLWTTVSSRQGIARARKALRHYGGGGRLVVGEDGRKVVREGGGCSWLRFTQARVEAKSAVGAEEEKEPSLEATPRVLGVLDAKFADILDSIAQLDKDSPSSVGDETRSVMDKIRNRLGELSAQCVTNTLVVLRHMSDFAQVNKVYGELFTFPNPRRGQAIDVPVSSSSGAAADAISGQPAAAPNPSPVRIVAIAGQIPLMPATMELPEPLESSLDLQIVLALQHLWRIGVEMKVQLWAGAVAYFPRAGSPEEMVHKAKRAALAWQGAHVGVRGQGGDEDDEDEDDENGPDLWDLKYNSEYMNYGEARAGPKPLPDWEAFRKQPNGEAAQRVPPFFAVEVEELPRQAGIEWHVHAALSYVESGAAHVEERSGVARSAALGDADVSWRASHTLAEAGGGRVFVHTTVAIHQGGQTLSAARIHDVIGEAAAASSSSSLSLASVAVGGVMTCSVVQAGIKADAISYLWRHRGGACRRQRRGLRRRTRSARAAICALSVDTRRGGNPIAVVALFRDVYFRS
ncbi:unnamed protein product [Parascedosporium putredinis]|uniref:Diphthine--ammonia ligase n=1 Tax=Parascedosporium putredinis TaxID=1442378 RepID=A0A9P1MB58_9PEZI|nr:unnamed protein product [Parascedosporium putredinis]CAI7998070.1 unnamed protein product [Parascedosporium putredinis]